MTMTSEGMTAPDVIEKGISPIIEEHTAIGTYPHFHIHFEDHNWQLCTRPPKIRQATSFPIFLICQFHQGQPRLGMFPLDEFDKRRQLVCALLNYTLIRTVNN